VASRRTHALAVAALAGLTLVAAGSALAHAPPAGLHVELPAAAAVDALPPATPGEEHSYDWPLRPFDRPHPLRGGFGDPRFGRVQRNFHFGVDIPAPDWTPVYAVAAGTVYLEPDHVDVLTHVAVRHSSGFSYWHILPAVHEHAFVRRHALLGVVSPTWHHLHFGEFRGGSWLNPLRPGALTPSAAPTRPQIQELSVAPADDGTGSDRVDVIVDAFAAPRAPPPPPWQDARVVPALIRWRLLAGTTPISGWREVVDFRNFIPPNRLFGDVYAPGTASNAPNRAGHYLFYLARDWDPDTLPPGTYVVQVQVVGSRGAVATAGAELSVAGTPTAVHAAVPG
jgi:hypothetical protein